MNHSIDDTIKRMNIENIIVEMDLFSLFLYTRYALYRPNIGESVKKNQDKNADILSPPKI